MLAINWGSAPEWVAAVGTVGSLFAALWLVRKEGEDRKQREVERYSAPAHRVSAWCLEEEAKLILAVKNMGEEPVYNCMIYVSGTGDFSGYPGQRPDSPREILYGTIPPGETLKDEKDASFAKAEHFGFPAIEVEFTDARGKHWRRDMEGAVTEIAYRHPIC